MFFIKIFVPIVIQDQQFGNTHHYGSTWVFEATNTFVVCHVKNIRLSVSNEITPVLVCITFMFTREKAFLFNMWSFRSWKIYWKRQFLLVLVCSQCDSNRIFQYQWLHIPFKFTYQSLFLCGRPLRGSGKYLQKYSSHKWITTWAKSVVICHIGHTCYCHIRLQQSVVFYVSYSARWSQLSSWPNFFTPYDLRNKKFLFDCPRAFVLRNMLYEMELFPFRKQEEAKVSNRHVCFQLIQTSVVVIVSWFNLIFFFLPSCRLYSFSELIVFTLSLLPDMVSNILADWNEWSWPNMSC